MTVRFLPSLSTWPSESWASFHDGASKAVAKGRRRLLITHVGRQLRRSVHSRSDPPGTPGLQMILFGSILDPSVQPGDIDVWIDGSESVVESALEQLSGLGTCAGLPIDVTAAPLLDKGLRDACLWNAAFGLHLLGTPPRTTPLDVAGHHQKAFQTRAALEASDVIAQAEVLLGTGASAGPEFVEFAARLYLRATATTPSEWRRARRLSSTELAALIAPARSSTPVPTTSPWMDPVVVGITRELIAALEPTGRT